MTTARAAAGTILLLTPTFTPDPAAVGQYMADLAVALAARGHRVQVYTANRGYDDPSIRYPAREQFHGVDVRRLPLSSFGKASFLTRSLGSLSFMAQCFIRGLFHRRLGAIVITTSPPFSDLAGAAVALFRRRTALVYWAMDLYSEQVVALGKRSRSAPSAMVLRWMQQFVLRRSRLVVALDRFMAGRLNAIAPVSDRTAVLPPWPLDLHLEPVEHAANPFRAAQGLQDKFVVMYSGNHTPTNPLTTLLQAAVELRDEPGIRFVFIGGGKGKKEVEDTIAGQALTNAVSLPYQPLEGLRYSLSAADLHVASLGDNLVGICHPCKVYGAMAVARPLLFLGPSPSHVADLLSAESFGWHVRHGDVAGTVAAIRAARDLPSEQRRAMGERARKHLQERLSRAFLSQELCVKLEALLGGAA